MREARGCRSLGAQQDLNKTNKTFYKVEDVRSSVASEIERLNGYDDACLLEDLPTSAGKFGPYKVTLATAAAFCLIEAEGVTLFAHDTQMGLCDEQDFDVEVLLPSGRMYALERSELSERETRPRKEHDKTCRVRFHLNIPPGSAHAMPKNVPRP